jgi:hypothetical protein
MEASCAIVTHSTPSVQARMIQLETNSVERKTGLGLAIHVSAHHICTSSIEIRKKMHCQIFYYLIHGVDRIAIDVVVHHIFKVLRILNESNILALLFI